uniref:Uncharacterized protein n=1 Tax=Oryza nivara TaxID=4536 RepID=A0A0E0GV05_ORYNI
MRHVTFFTAVLVAIFLTSGGGRMSSTAARPTAVGGAGAPPAAVAVELAGTGTGTNASSQPSNCTYGNNVGGQCPPTPGAGH